MVSTALKVFAIVLIPAVGGLSAGILGLSKDLLLVLCVAGVAAIFISGLAGRRQSTHFFDLFE
jgi:hypothetical protein